MAFRNNIWYSYRYLLNRLNTFSYFCFTVLPLSMHIRCGTDIRKHVYFQFHFTNLITVIPVDFLYSSPYHGICIATNQLPSKLHHLCKIGNKGQFVDPFRASNILVLKTEVHVITR